MTCQDRELESHGFLRTWDGKALDNRDGFYDDHPDTIATYDTRAYTVISRSLLEKLLVCWAEKQLTDKTKEDLI